MLTSILQDWFVLLDLQYMYLHIVIHLAHKKRLMFMMGSNHYQYKVLPFGLSTALRAFMKCLAVVAAHLRRQGIHHTWLFRGRLQREMVAT